MNIEQYKINSLNEVVATDIADADEIISAIIGQKQLDSLAYQICDVQTIHGPTGGHYSIQYQPGTNKVVVLRNNVTVEDDALQNTGFTLESIQDIQNEFGKNAIDFIGRTFGGIASGAENVKVIAKLAAVAAGTSTLILSAPTNRLFCCST
jgi:hypothetical protein